MQPTGGVFQNSRDKNFEKVSRKISLIETFSAIVCAKMQKVWEKRILMKFSEQLLHRTHADSCSFDFLMKMLSFFGKGIALYYLIESRWYLIQMTISQNKQDFVLTTLSLYILYTLTVFVIGVIQKVHALENSNFWPLSFPCSSLLVLHVTPTSTYVRISELSHSLLKKSSVTLMNFQMKNQGTYLSMYLSIYWEVLDR